MIKITFLFLFLFVLIFSAQTSVYAYEQTPWQTNQNGTLYPGTIAWNYTMGYSFTPLKDGQITRLGGFFEGEKTVRLWNKNTGAELASAVVVGKFGEWRYTSIFPVDVVAGTTYIVAAYMNSSGAAYQYSINLFPQVYGDIVIEATSYNTGDKKPIGFVTSVMYGQADVVFISFEDMSAERNITREIERILGDKIKVTLDIQAAYSGLKAFWIIEYIPEGSEVLDVSHGGVIFNDRIEWIASEFTELPVDDIRIFYEIINEGSDHAYDGTWLSINPEEAGMIGGQSQDD